MVELKFYCKRPYFNEQNLRTIIQPRRHIRENMHRDHALIIRETRSKVLKVKHVIVLQISSRKFIFIRQ